MARELSLLLCCAIFEPNFDADGLFVASDVEQERRQLLDTIEAEFNDKAENIAVYLKSLYVEVAAMHDEERTLRARRLIIEQRAERLKKYMIASMNAIGLKKIDMPRARLTIRKNAESLVVDDELSFIKWAQENAQELLKANLPDIRKTDTKKTDPVGQIFAVCPS